MEVGRGERTNISFQFYFQSCGVKIATDFLLIAYSALRYFIGPLSRIGVKSVLGQA